MAHARFAVFGLVAGLVLSLAPSCGGQPAACDASWCGGCCDEKGQCVSGDVALACGTGGLACNACGTGEVCQAGACAVDPALITGADAGATPTGPIVFSASISPNPAVVGNNTATITLKGTNGVAVTGATLTAQTWMPAMGHGSATPTVSEVGDGVYTVSGVRFTMPGTWQLKLAATATGGLTGNKTFSYAVN